MLLQSLLLIVTLIIVGGAILTSSLVTAKAAFHAKVVRAGESAMNDATAEFVAWAQNNVRQNGIDRMPIWAAIPQTPAPAPACSTGAGESANQTAADACKLYETIRWNVTGYTGAVGNANASVAQSLAEGLSSAQDEQRLSATISVAITDPQHVAQYAYRSRVVTARIFHSAPYATLTAEKDALSEEGAITGAEGDTAGYAYQYRDAIASNATPDPSTPASYTDTVIKTTVDCINTADNAEPDALADDTNVIFSRLRDYGNVAWVYEMPCKPMQHVNPATAPVGYEPPINNVYRSRGTIKSQWTKNNENGTSFAW